MFKKLFPLGTALILSVGLTGQVLALTSPVTGHRVVIDPGHGGSSTGSTECPGYPESHANLDIAYELKALLKDEATVYMTREDDSYKSNADRYNYANNETDGEVLVSIHLNGSTNHDIDGTQGLYGKRNKDKAFTQVMHNALWGNLKDTPDFKDFGVTNFASGVLLKSNMPATIQETVFISSTYECNLLKAGVEDETMERQKEIAQALYNGLKNWFGEEQPPSDKPGKGHGHGKPKK